MALKGKIYSLAKQYDDLNTNEIFESMMEESADRNSIVLDGRNIAAGSIYSEQIHAGSITADKIRADAITADHMNVGNLSAISTNIGEITAGIIRSRDNGIHINLNTGIIDLSKPLTINSKPVATSEQVTQAVDGVDSKVAALSTRMSNAEVKIEPSAIVTTVTGHTTFKDVKEKAEAAKSTLGSKSSAWDAKATTGYVDGKAGTAETNAKNYAKQQVDDLEIGGRNLLRNSDFSSGLEGWSPYGGTSLLINNEGNLIVDYSTAIKSLYNGILGYAQEIESGETYTITAKVRRSSPDLSLAIQLTTRWGRVDAPPVNEWGIIKYTTSKITTVNNTNFWIHSPDITQEGILEISWIKLEKGNKATDWSPAPEDVEEGIESAQSTADNAKSTADTLKNTTVPQLTTRVNTAEQKITDTAIRNTVTSHSTFKTVQENASLAKSTLDSKSSTWDAKATTGYVDNKASTAETNAKTHADGKASTAETNAKSYADTQASNAETRAKTHADNASEIARDLAILDSYLQSGRSIQNVSDDLTHIRFDRGYIQFPDSAKNLVHGKQSATIEFWVKKYDRNYGFMQLSGFANGNGTIYPYGDSGNGNQVYLDTFRTNRLGGTNLKYDVLEWHHFAVTTHPTHGWKLYQNGELIRTVDGQSVVDVSYLDFRIGQNSNNRWAKASFRDIRLWDRYRTQEDIARDMGRLLYGDEDGLVGYWRLDEGQGSIAKDIVNGNDGTITNGVWGGNRSEIQETQAEQAVISERVRTAEQKITDSAIISTVTESNKYKNEMTGKVSVDEIISRINQTAENITIEARRINLQGAVTFSSFGTDVTSKLDDIESDASTAKSTASSAQSTASTAKSTADTANKAASEAKTTAAAASSTASTAKSTADTASSTASTAKATADTASSVANTAKSTLDSKAPIWDAKETTTGAQTKANTAASAAEATAKAHADKVSRLTVLDSSNKKFSNLAGVQNKTASVTGYLIIRTPITTPYMTKVKISGYNYLSNNTNIDLTVGFYAYSNSFLQHSFISNGDFPIEDVHLARDSSGRAVIIAGKSNTKWSYPSINIDEAQIGYSNPPDSYLDGWSIEFSTDISEYASQRVKINGGDVSLRIDSADNKAANAKTKTDKWTWGNTTEIDGGSIRAKTITAEELNVNELSSLTANLGKVTAGTISSNDGTSTINLTNGTFSLAGGKIGYNGSVLSLNADEINLDGKVTFDSLNTSLKSTVETTQEQASTAKTAAEDAKGKTDAWSYDGTTEIDGASIRTDTLSVDKITGRIPGEKITLDGNVNITSGLTVPNANIGNLTASKITSGTMHGNRIQANTLSANRINTDTLSAITANLGTVTAGTLKSANGATYFDLDLGLLSTVSVALSTQTTISNGYIEQRNDLSSNTSRYKGATTIDKNGISLFYYDSYMGTVPYSLSRWEKSVISQNEEKLSIDAPGGITFGQEVSGLGTPFYGTISFMHEPHFVNGISAQRTIRTTGAISADGNVSVGGNLTVGSTNVMTRLNTISATANSASSVANSASSLASSAYTLASGKADKATSVNGYIKMEDGTLINWHSGFQLTRDDSTRLSGNWSFSVNFYGNPTVVATREHTHDTTSINTASIGTSRSSNSVLVRMFRNSGENFPVGTTASVRIIAIGRWK